MPINMRKAQEQLKASVIAVETARALTNNEHFSTFDQTQTLLQTSNKMNDLSVRIKANQDILSKIAQLNITNPNSYEAFISDECGGDDPLPETNPKNIDTEYLNSVFIRYNNYVKNRDGIYIL